MANTNGAWVITGGKYRGVMKLVSRAMQNRVAEDKEKLRRLPCIGICTWGRVSERDSLLQGDYRYDPSEIEASSKTEKGTTALDPNHTHFLMVDDGTEHRERTHQPWHGKFHRFIEKGGRQLHSFCCNTYIEPVVGARTKRGLGNRMFYYYYGVKRVANGSRPVGTN